MRKFLTTFVAIFIAAVALLVSGCGGYKHQPRPKLPPGVVAPNCGTVAPKLPTKTWIPTIVKGKGGHSLGQCLPKSVHRITVPNPKGSGSIRCVDLSNNDPIYGVGNWRLIRNAGFQCAYFKITEGTVFVDGTAAAMVRDAKQAGLYVGGYGFQHVCWDSAQGEAGLFVQWYKNDGLAQGNGYPLANTMPPMEDTEYGNGNDCNGRDWVNSWRGSVGGGLHRGVSTYTGQWFWDPAFGCWWPGGYAWISGYTGSIGSVPRPCGHSNIDLWQYADNGWNGVSNADASIWSDSNSSFQTFAYAAPPPDPYGFLLKLVIKWDHTQASEYNTVKTWDGYRPGNQKAAPCKRPVRRPTCIYSSQHLEFLAGRDWYLAHNVYVNGHWQKRRGPADWNTYGGRFHAMWVRYHG